VIDARVEAAVGAAVIDAWGHRFGGGIDRHHSVVGASCGGDGAPLGVAVGGDICGRWGLRCTARIHKNIRHVIDAQNIRHVIVHCSMQFPSQATSITLA
jgi:hypothetical protein